MQVISPHESGSWKLIDSLEISTLLSVISFYPEAADRNHLKQEYARYI